jgi:hypothetical protein
LKTSLEGLLALQRSKPVRTEGKRGLKLAIETYLIWEKGILLDHTPVIPLVGE